MRIRSTTHADPGEEFVPAKPEGLNEQGRSRHHQSSDEDDQTRKQHYVAQEHTHTRLPLHLFCAGRPASAKVRPLQSLDARGRPCLLQALCFCFEAQ